MNRARRILVIEDNLDLLEGVKAILLAEGFEVVETTSGRSAIELATNSTPDLILCDVMMPEMDGYTVLQELRRSTNQSVPFIFLTSLTDYQDVRQGMELGADDYLAKPFKAKDLVKAINTRLSRYNQLEDFYALNNAKNAENMASQLSSLGLPNWLSLREEFYQQTVLQPKAGQLFGLIYISIDRFERIGESMGYSFEETLLKEVGNRLVACVSNNGIVAHLSGDRFAVFLYEETTINKINELTKVINTKLALPYHLQGREIFITVSQGGAIYPYDGFDLNTLLKKAQLGLNAARKQGGDQIQLYNETLALPRKERLHLETELHYALERSEFELYYQLQLNISTGEPSGAEALIRWWHPERGLIMPGQFIELAEETGQIIPMGEWILQRGLAQLKSWQTAGLPSIRLAINLSGVQLGQPNLVPKIKQLLEVTELKATQLEAEITETSLMQNLKQANLNLMSLNQLGVTIAIDDFGTGYSSFAYLRQFPIDRLKIDQIFVRNLASDYNNQTITHAIIDLAHKLNLPVVAEGVESEQELTLLKGWGCDYMQGYLVSRPIPAQQFAQLLCQPRGSFLNSKILD